MITLPDEIIPAVSDLTANNILVVADYGVGKSCLLASTGYLLADPEDKLRSIPCMRVTLSNWQDHKDFVKEVSKKPTDKYKGIGLDSLNVSYDHCSAWVMKNVKFNGITLSHPSENPQIAYPRVTNEFITWLREVTYLGYHVVATCHASVSEIKSKTGAIYNRWIPAFTGGAPSSTYSQVLKIFSIIGFMTLEEVVKPPTKITSLSKGKAIVDLRADSRGAADTEEARVINFGQSPHWLSNNKLNGFPDKVVLTDNWKEDWKILTEAWNTGDGHEVTETEVQTAELKI